jgi:integrase/recombinase XerD
VTHLRKAMLEELQRRNLSQITTRIYLRSVEEFAQYFNTRPDRLGLEHVRSTKPICSPIANWKPSA